MSHILPDVLESGLSVVFCGTAASKVSAEMGVYYAHSNNLFWKILHEAGFTPRRLPPHEYSTVKQFGIGLTDLVKDDFGGDSEIRSCTESDRDALRSKILETRPGFVAFTSKTAGRRYFRKTIELGEQAQFIGSTRVFVLPSTSLKARWQWPETAHHWRLFASAVQCARGI